MKEENLMETVMTRVGTKEDVNRTLKLLKAEGERFQITEDANHITVYDREVAGNQVFTALRKHYNFWICRYNVEYWGEEEGAS